METSYQWVRLPAFSTNSTKTLVKSPKWYWADAGLAWWIARNILAAPWWKVL